MYSFVAKVVKTFDAFLFRFKTLDEFRYKYSVELS